MFRDSMILTFSKGIRGLLMLIFNMLISRAFSQSVYGTYKQINLIINMLTAILTFGIPTSISYFYSLYDKDKKQKFIGNTILILSIISFFAGTTVILFKNQIASILNNNDLVFYINTVAIYVMIMILSSFLENWYITSNQSVLLGKIYIVYIISNFVVMVCSVLIFKELIVLIQGMVLIETIRTIIMYLLIKFKEDIKLGFDFGMAKTQIQFSISIGIVTIIQIINVYIDNIFVSNNYSTEEYAFFANAATDIPFVSIVTVSIATVVLPKISEVCNKEKDYKKMLSIWSDSCVKTSMIMFPIFWIALLFREGYISIVFSERYVLNSTPIFMIYLMKFPLYCTVFGNVLIALGKQKYIMYNSMIGVMLNIVLNALFIKIFGIKGPAISTVLVQYIVVFLQLKEISKSTKVKIRNLLEYKTMLKILYIPGLVTIPFYIIFLILNIPDKWGLIVFGPFIYVCSIAIYYKLKYISKDIIKDRVANVN